MGQGCCYPKDQDGDLRGTNQAKKKGKGQLEQNIFKQQPREPDFVVTRRDSLGMAAKEHNEGIVMADGMRRSVQSATNTDGVRSSVEQQAKPVFTEGTFADQVLQPNIGTDDFDNRYEEVKEHQLPKNSLGCVSFGASNDRIYTNDSFHEKADLRKVDGSNHSVISIRDIQEVRDKVPASPATAVKQPQQDYFQ